MADCIFCKIAAKQQSTDVEYEDDEIIAFKDIYPKAPIHILIIPKRHIESVMVLSEEDAPLVGRLVLVAKRLGAMKSVADRGYRLQFHCGPEGGQVVYHLHLHFMAGKR
jgi:histidine triad (HIT) family protein